jgi:hypothetical protein
LFIKVLQNRLAVFFTVNPDILRSKKVTINVFNVLQNQTRRSQPEVLYRVFRGKCKSVLFGVIPSVLPFLRSENEKKGDFELLQNDLGVFFPVLSRNIAVISFNKGEIN